MKRKSIFYPSNRIDNAVTNCGTYLWAKEILDKTVSAAEPYLAVPDDELWNRVFSASLPRSWFVLSYGTCPVCGNSVPMYAWRTDPQQYPWKVICPHCSERFPKNDFYAFYQSGLNRQGEFCHELADRTLLFNTEHPDAADPLHLFCVDDGNGWQSEKYKDPYMFIGMYLVNGQWRKQILAPINVLSNAYTLTRNKAYAHKAAVLLDRLADFFPTYNWTEQGVMYELRNTGVGYIVYGVASATECIVLGLAYDRIFDAIREDEELVRFLSKKARQTGSANPKQSFADIQKNIEERFFAEVISHVYEKCTCNFPLTHLCDIVLRMVVGWPENKADILLCVDEVMKRGTAVDGISGEKGTAGYSTASPSGIAELFSLFEQMDEQFLDELFARYPHFVKTFTFHIDAWCNQRYYPALEICTVNPRS